MRPDPLVYGVLLVLGVGLLAGPARAEGCLECHAKPSEGGSHKPLVDAEAWAAGVHAGLGCTDCHEVLSRAQSVRACGACHDVNAPLIAKYVGKDDPSSWVTQPLLFQDA